MNVHKNARLTPRGRERIVLQVESGQTPWRRSVGTVTRMANVPDINDVQPQRGGKDCVIAAIATLVARSYDEVARGLGLPFSDGKWDVGDGVDASDAIYLLLSWGWIAAPLVSKECAKKHKLPENNRPTSDQIKALLIGRPAVVGYTDLQIGPHALAWDGSKAIDCSDVSYVDLENITIETALILSPPR